MAAVICALSFAYSCVFFMKKIKHKIAALFAIDAFVLTGLFFTGAAPAVTAAFILSAAASNITVLFMPGDEGLQVIGPKDIAAITGNIIAAAFGAFILLKSPNQPAAAGPAFNPSFAAFLFMVLSTALFFAGTAGTGGKK